ncbi:hypothetical protein RMATCC62417_08984 [Rhizopus microsporus]|nr:hypothetical protein RMATCC62417_08984 [Rhizopus microsporus]CEI88483.1 hypothetical protein RMCBS344292_02871 [Rhizopus microsporus]
MSNRNTLHVKNTKPNNNNNNNIRHSFAASKPHNNNNNNNHAVMNKQAIQQPKKSQKNNRRKSKKVYEDDSSSSSSSEESDAVVPSIKSTKRKSSPKRPVHIDYKSLVDQVYAGPTFNNAPAPSSLPLPPVFHRSPTMYPEVIHSAYEMEQTNMVLSEIQRGLRSMLKIES